MADLKDVLAAKIQQRVEDVKVFREKYGSTIVGDVTVDMVTKI